MKNLILTADDFGYLNCIDKAIIELVAAGRISAVSAFGNVEIGLLTSKIKRLVEANPNVGVGVHLTISSHEPVLQTKTVFTQEINGRQQFCEPRQLNFNRILKQENELKLELQAQINQLKTALNGKQIDHISCHHNLFYFNKKLFKIYTELANENNLPIRTPQNCIKIKRFKGIKKLESILPAIALEGLKTMPIRHLIDILRSVRNKTIKRQKATFSNLGLRTPDYFMINLYGNPKIEIAALTYQQMLEDDVCEQIMHVGLANAENEAVPVGINAQYFEGRTKEFNLLNSSDYGTLISTNQVVLGSYTDFLGNFHANPADLS
jgi:predicted glycoside hydrolase/deacetylase ChbG (UPF0249 family)